MLTKTSELAVKTLLFLALESEEEPQSPRQIAERIDCSASYLAKILRTLVGAGILRSIRGAHGGVFMNRKPSEISLLEVVEACQGILVGDYCQEGSGDESVTCSYHQAMNELHNVMVETLSKWSVQDLLTCPVSTLSKDGKGQICKMTFHCRTDLLDSEERDL